MTQGSETVHTTEEEGIEFIVFESSQNTVGFTFGGDIAVSTFVRETCGQTTYQILTDSSSPDLELTSVRGQSSVSGDCYDNFESILEGDISGDTIEFETHEDGEEGTVTASNGYVAIVEGDRSPPDNWPESTQTDKDHEAVINQTPGTEFCPGDRVQFEAEVHNRKITGEDFHISYSVDSDIDGVSDSGIEEIGGRSSHTVNISESIDSDAEHREVSEVLEFETSSYDSDDTDGYNVGGGQVGNDEDSLAITSSSFPDRVEVGDRETFTVTLDNAGSCDDTVAVYIESDVIERQQMGYGDVRLSGGETNTVEESSLTIPSIDSVEISDIVEMTVERDGVEILSVEDEMTIESIDGQLESVTIPSDICVGSEASVEAEASIEIQEADVTFELESNYLDAQTETTSIRAGSTGSVTFDIDAPTDLPVGEELEISVSAYTDSVGDEPISLGVSSDTANITSSDFQVTNVDFPETARVGETEDFAATITNEGVCDDSLGIYLQSDNIERQQLGFRDLSLDAGETDTVEESRVEIPEIDGSEEVVTVTVERDGEVVESYEQVVEIESIDAEFESIDYPDEVCRGQDFTISAEASVDVEGADVTFEIESDDLDYDSATTYIPEGGIGGVDIDVQAPYDISANDDINFTVTASAETDAGETAELGEISGDASIATSDMDVSSVDMPDELCSGKEDTMAVTISNQGDCAGEVRVTTSGEFLDETDEEYEVSAGGSTQFDADLSIPSGISQEVSTTTIEVVVDEFDVETQGWVEIEDVNETVNVLHPDTTISLTQYEEEVCAGSEVSFEADIENDGECDDEVRVVVESDVGVSEVIEETSLRSGRRRRTSGEIYVPSDVATDRVGVEVEVQTYTDGWQRVDHEEFSIDVDEADVVIGEVPDVVEGRPGSTELTVALENIGECDGDIEVEFGEQTVEETIYGGDRLEIDFTTDLGVERGEKHLTVKYADSGYEMAEATVEFVPNRYLHLDTSESVVEIVGGFDDEVGIAGQVVGDDIETDLEEDGEFNVIAGLFGKRYTGELGTDSGEVRRIEAEDIQYISTMCDEELTWVVDGEVEGESNTFAYGTRVGRAIMPGGELDIPEPETSATGSIGSSLGVVRSMF